MNRSVIAALVLTASLGVNTAHAVPVQWTAGSGGNDHWYDFIAGGIDWFSANTAAQSLTHLGQSGYLVTITSAEEDAFIRASVSTSRGWAGGSDAATEGLWQWVTGPESGQAFGFTAWGPGEPNDSGNEDHLLINQHGVPNTWNDGPGGLGFEGYFVEFAPADNQTPALPAPGTLAMLALGLAGLGLRRTRT